MKIKAWLFILIFVSGSIATVSVFAESDLFGGSDREISNDEMAKDKMDAAEAAETCQLDCVKEETSTCNAEHDVMNHRVLNACLNQVDRFCERKCN